jgi:hypothetical protein
MAAVSGAGLGELRQGVGGALMNSNGASGKKKKARKHNDDGGTMSLKKAYKSGKLKKKAKSKKKKNKKKKGNKKYSSHGGAKAHARVLPQDEDNPPVPICEEPGLSLIEQKMVQLGQKNEGIRDVMAGTLGPTSEWLKSIADPEENPYLAHLHNSIPAEAGAVIGATVATPGLQDDLTIGALVGTAFIAYHTITFFGKKDHRPPHERSHFDETILLPQQQTLPRIVNSNRNNPKKPDDDDDDKLVKGLTDVLVKIMESRNVSMGAKVLTGMLSLFYVTRVLTSEKSKDENKTSLEVAQTRLAPVSTPKAPMDTPVIRMPIPTVFPEPTPAATNTPIPTDTPVHTQTPTPSPGEAKEDRQLPRGITRE